MGGIRGFRCNQCHAELITGRSPGGAQIAADRSPPILCCGHPLRALRPDEVVAAMPVRRQVAQCPRCGYVVDLVVHPPGPLVCVLCQIEFGLRVTDALPRYSGGQVR
jgi:hypothetical protein